MVCTTICVERRIGLIGSITPIKTMLDFLASTNVVNPKLLTTNLQRIDGATQSKPSDIVAEAAANHVDIDTTNVQAINILEVIEVTKITVDFQVQVSTEFAKIHHDTVDGGTKINVNQDVVDHHVLADMSGVVRMIDRSMTSSSDSTTAPSKRLASKLCLQSCVVCSEGGANTIDACCGHIFKIDAVERLKHDGRFKVNARVDGQMMVNRCKYIITEHHLSAL